jgi:hypothetical protein
VDIKRHRILPEPFDAENIDENEHVVYIDGLLCYVPYDKLAKKRLREIRKADVNLNDVFASYDERTREMGVQLDDETKEKFGLTR